MTVATAAQGRQDLGLEPATFHLTRQTEPLSHSHPVLVLLCEASSDDETHKPILLQTRTRKEMIEPEALAILCVLVNRETMKLECWIKKWTQQEKGFIFYAKMEVNYCFFTVINQPEQSEKSSHK